MYLKLLDRRACLILFLVGECLFPTQQKRYSLNNQWLIIYLLLPSPWGPGKAGMYWRDVPLASKGTTTGFL